jgi:hypothetical protein
MPLLAGKLVRSTVALNRIPQPASGHWRIARCNPTYLANERRRELGLQP